MGVGRFDGPESVPPQPKLRGGATVCTKSNEGMWGVAKWSEHLFLCHTVVHTKNVCTLFLLTLGARKLEEFVPLVPLLTTTRVP